MREDLLLLEAGFDFFSKVIDNILNTNDIYPGIWLSVLSSVSSDVESYISACAAGRAAISSIQFLNTNSQGVALRGPLLNESSNEISWIQTQRTLLLSKDSRGAGKKSEIFPS